MNPLERRRLAQAHLAEHEAAGNVADSQAVRQALMAQVHTGTLTLDQAQAELKRLQRQAKAQGKLTRNQARRP